MTGVPATDRRERGSFGSWPLGLSSLWRILAAWIVIVAIGVGLGWWVVKASPSGLEGIDRTASVEIADERTSTLTQWSQWASSLGGTIEVVAIVVVLGLLFLWRFRRWRETLVLWGALSLEASMFLVISTVVGRSRPPVEQLDHAPTASFPSGHMGAATALYVTLGVIAVWHLRHRILRLVVPVLAAVPVLLVGASRLYRGMHYVTDLAAGFLFGAAAVYVSIRVVEWARHHDRTETRP